MDEDTVLCHLRGCRHLRAAEIKVDGMERVLPVCAAFPNGIPDAIYRGSVLHLTVYPGQVGFMVFEYNDEA